MRIAKPVNIYGLNLTTPVAVEFLMFSFSSALNLYTQKDEATGLVLHTPVGQFLLK